MMRQIHSGPERPQPLPHWGLLLMAGCLALLPSDGMAASLQELLAESELEASLASVLQTVDRNGTEEGRGQARSSYRGDIAVTLPLHGPGQGTGSILGHVRFGQGAGVGTRPFYTGAVNSLAFDTASPGDSFAILAQLYYHLEYPLGTASIAGGRRVELTAGKIDPFGFFDQNAVADDESTAFLDNVFVHNPLLDSGGDLGADRYGFAPGLRAAWYDDSEPSVGWGASVGAFGAGRAADFSGSPGRPFVIVQARMSSKRANGNPMGTFRLYRWSNPQAEDFDGSQSRHVGWGLSADQQVGDTLSLFGRYGRRIRGHGEFDAALTLGLAVSGAPWGRADDAIGLAGGRLLTDDAYGRAREEETAVSPSSAERIVEVFYRIAVSRYFQITADWQLVRHPRGDPTAPAVRVAGIRARVGL
jgi:hypothetical protein